MYASQTRHSFKPAEPWTFPFVCLTVQILSVSTSTARVRKLKSRKGPSSKEKHRRKAVHCTWQSQILEPCCTWIQT